jgi:hypothetical protein
VKHGEHDPRFPHIKARVYDFLHREKVGTLNPEETSELDNYLQLEHIMRLAKAQARKFPAPD